MTCVLLIGFVPPDSIQAAEKKWTSVLPEKLRSVLMLKDENVRILETDDLYTVTAENSDGTLSVNTFSMPIRYEKDGQYGYRTGIYQNHANVFQYPHNETSDWYLEPITIGVTMIGSADVTLNLIESRKLNAYVTPEIAPQDLIWTSSSPASVAVQGDGTITGVGVGGATITACSVIDGSQYVTWSVSVTPPPHIYPSSITINGKPENNALLEGQSHSLTASVLPSNSAYRDVQWSSSNPSVATVLGGTITALSPGVTTITAKIIGPLSYTDSFELRVYIDPTLHERETIELSIVDSIFISQLVNPECSFNKPGSEYAFDFERAYALLQVFKNATPQSGHSLVSGETLEELGYCEPGAGDGAEALLNMMYGNSLSGKTMLDQAMEDNARWQAQLGTALAFMYYDAIFNTLDRQFVITDETFSPTSRLDMIEKSLYENGFVTYSSISKFRVVSTSSINPVLNELLNKSLYIEVPEMDCSEIAEDFFNASGHKGRIYVIKPKSSLEMHGYDPTENWLYHEVYSDGRFIYDPRYRNKPVIIDEYFDMFNALNPDGLIIE